MKESDQIDRIAQYLSGDLPEVERKKLLLWTKESEENQSLFEETQKLWELAEQYQAPAFEADLPAAWDKVDSRLDAPAAVKSLTSISIYRQVLRIAAVFLVGALAVWWLWSPSASEISTLAVIQTEAMEVRELTLPDGSQVWLNGDSELRYDEKFDQRRVELKGEAFFDIARMEEKPFEIYSGVAKTLVLGTAFNVRAYPTEDKVEVTVVRGKVALTETKETQKAILLEAGNAGSYDKAKQTVQKEEAPKANADSWKTEKLVFENTQLNEVIESLERYFNVDIEASNPSVLNCHFTGNYEKPQLDQILEVLAFGVDLSIEKYDDRYLLEGIGCEEIPQEK